MKKPSFLKKIPSDNKSKNNSVLAVHGMNQNPDTLFPLLNHFSKNGLTCYIYRLPEHREGCKKISSRELIYEEFKNCYKYILDEHGTVDYFLGYSFGGLIGEALLEKYPFQKMLLLAPAIKLRFFTHGIRPLLPFFEKILSVPIGNSEAEKKYRYHRFGVSTSIYKSLFDIYSDFQKVEEAECLNRPTQIFCHPRDELVSFNKLKQICENRKQWSFESVSNRDAKFRRYNHLCVDENTLGIDSFVKIRDKSLAFLLSKL